MSTTLPPPTRQRYAVDQAEIRRAVQLLSTPGQVVEVRALNATSAGWRAPHTISGYFSDAELLTKAVASTITGAKGIYCTLNEITPALLARAENRLKDLGKGDPTTADGDVLRRLWLPIDLDPMRPAEISSSEAEHTLALDRARRIAEHLQGEGWPAPIIGDSGNGGHLLWRIDLPAEDGGLVQQCLEALAARFDDALVKVDQKVFNPARIWKLYGTWATKGDNTADRPHRRAKLLDVPDQVQVVSEAQLRALAATRPQQPAQPRGTYRGTGAARAEFDLPRWISEHLPEADGPRDWSSQAGKGRKWVLDCPWNSDHAGGCAWISELGNGAISAGCQHQSCKGNGWAELRALKEPGYADRRSGAEYGARRSTTDQEPPAWSTDAELLSAAPGKNGHQPAGRPVAEIIAELDALRPEGGGKPERSLAEAKALDLVADCQGLSKADLQRIIGAMHALGLPQEFTRQWRSAVREAKHTPAGAAGDQPDVIPYEVDAGHIYKVSTIYTEAGPELQRTVVADFAAHIAEEITGEDGHRLYNIAGSTADGQPFTIEISAEKFADDGALLAALDEAAGAYAPVRAKMSAHLRPAIKLLTRQAGKTRQTRRYQRTGWAGGHFLLPGREPPDTSITLPAKLAYTTAADADLQQGLLALDELLQALDLPSTTVALAAILQAPLAAPAGWIDERSAAFIAGRTGSLKTSWAQCGMCIFGRFASDAALLKWGEGATRMAIMNYATHATDMPLLLDNFKPNTGDGARGFTNLVHNLVEGTDKDRMQRSKNELRDTAPIRCWPIFTGEDVPAEDPATIARLLVIRFHWDVAGDNVHLTRAQAAARHLPAVGDAWLSWLESAEGQRVAQAAGQQLVATRATWISALKSEEKDAVNAARIASNLAINQLTWWVLRQHPSIGPIIEKYAAEHRAGLEAIATDMARRSKVAREAVRFLQTLSELISTGKASLEIKGKLLSGNLPERRIGWIDEGDGSYYLLFDVAKREVLKVLGADGLGNLSDNTLHSQLREMGMIASSDPGRNLKKVRVIPGERAQWCLHLRAEAIGADEEAGDV